MIFAKIHTTTFDPAKKASVSGPTELEELNEEGLREAAHQCDRLKEEITDKLESSVLMMQGLRLELLRIKERGVGAMSDNLALATQQARAITRDIDNAISAAAEVKGL